MGCYNTGLGSFQKWAIGNVIRDILLDDEEVRTQTNGNIFPIVASEDTKGDFIIYRRTQYSKEAVKVGVYQDTCEIELIAICDDYNDSFELAAKIDRALTGYHTIDNRKVSMMLSNSTEGWEDNKYFQTITFTIK